MSKKPKYVEIMNYIRKKIESGEYKANQRIPSERDLATLLNVSRMTARLAINELTNEGLLYKQLGSGTFISGMKYQKSLFPLTSFTEDMAIEGKPIRTQLVGFEVRECSSIISEKLGIAKNDKIYRIARLRFTGEDVLLYEVIYQPVSLLPSLNEEAAKGSIYQFIEKNNLMIAYSNMTIEATSANEELADIMQLSVGDPILLMRDLTHLNNGTVINYVKSFYVANRFFFTSTITRLHNRI